MIKYRDVIFASQRKRGFLTVALKNLQENNHNGYDFCVGNYFFAMDTSLQMLGMLASKVLTRAKKKKKNQLPPVVTKSDDHWIESLLSMCLQLWVFKIHLLSPKSQKNQVVDEQKIPWLADKIYTETF